MIYSPNPNFLLFINILLGLRLFFCSNIVSAQALEDKAIANNREQNLYLAKRWNQDEEANSPLHVVDSALTSLSDNKTDNAAEKPNADLSRYKRVSIYTLITNYSSKPYNNSLINAMANSTVNLPDNYNNHDVGPYLIPLTNDKNVAGQIEAYLNSSKAANQLIAKWFRRAQDGSFDMNLVAERGEYDASFLEQNIAMKTVRGAAMLQDAGEELIGRTFLIVYDPKFMVQNSTCTLSVGCYLYRLVWNDETANSFYENYWINRNQNDPNRKQAFENSNEFKVQYVGMVNVESEPHLYKEIKNHKYLSEALDSYVMNNFIKKIWTRLEETFIDLRPRFTLFSTNPLAAKIGTKEGIKAGDKFEVLEKNQTKEGYIQFRRKGIISVAAENHIWENDLKANWFGKSKVSREYTVFEGEKNKYAPGMLFRKIYQ